MESCLQSGNSIALELSQCMEALLAAVSSISKPQLFDWKMRFISEETAVFSPHIVILVTVTSGSLACAWIIYSACTNLSSISRWCSTPVIHSNAIAWHPPSECFVSVNFKQYGGMTLILDELFTVQGNSGEIRKLGKTCSCVINITGVTTLRFTSVHQRSVFAVVTYKGHANSILVSHVTGDVTYRGQTSFAVRVNDVSATFRCRVKLL